MEDKEVNADPSKCPDDGAVFDFTHHIREFTRIHISSVGSEPDATGTKVFMLRFEEGDVKDAIKRSETFGPYSTKDQAVKNATAAMRKKCSTGDPVDGGDDVDWDTAVRNTDPDTCPGEGFVFNFATDGGAFCRIRILSGALDKPFAEEATVVPSDEAPAVADSAVQRNGQPSTPSPPPKPLEVDPKHSIAYTTSVLDECKSGAAPS